MSYQNHGSFKFGGIDMYQQYGIMILDTGMPQDAFIPALRSRKMSIPQRHGQYDFGAKYYEERTITLNCITAKRMPDYTFRTFAREVSWALSKKSELRLWNEPDKYYVGRIYDEIQLIQLRDTGNEFNLVFICEPFAYGEPVNADFNIVQMENVLGEETYSITYRPEYKGTAPTPAFIQIVNNGETPAKNIRISQINRRDSY